MTKSPYATELTARKARREYLGHWVTEGVGEERQLDAVNIPVEKGKKITC